jgi:hypothetical protein
MHSIQEDSCVGQSLLVNAIATRRINGEAIRTSGSMKSQDKDQDVNQ